MLLLWRTNAIRFLFSGEELMDGWFLMFSFPFNVLATSCLVGTGPPVVVFIREGGLGSRELAFVFDFYIYTVCSLRYRVDVGGGRTPSVLCFLAVDL